MIQVRVFVVSHICPLFSCFRRSRDYQSHGDLLCPRCLTTKFVSQNHDTRLLLLSLPWKMDTLLLILMECSWTKEYINHCWNSEYIHGELAISQHILDYFCKRCTRPEGSIYLVYAIMLTSKQKSEIFLLLAETLNVPTFYSNKKKKTELLTQLKHIISSKSSFCLQRRSPYTHFSTWTETIQLCYYCTRDP